METVITYRRAEHAAHYHPANAAKGHDLESWDVAGDLPRGRYGDPVRPEGVPASAEYHSGYIDADGVQHWFFVRRAPLSGTCEEHGCHTARTA